jgi:hypothetical protein
VRLHHLAPSLLLLLLLRPFLLLLPSLEAQALPVC